MKKLWVVTRSIALIFCKFFSKSALIAWFRTEVQILKTSKTKLKRILRNQIQINSRKSVMEINQISNLLKDLQLMMKSVKYLRKKQRMISKSGVKQVTVKIAKKIKNKKSCLTRNLILMNSKMGLKGDKQIKGKNKSSNSLIIWMMKWI